MTHKLTLHDRITAYDGPLYTVQGEDGLLYCFNTLILLTLACGKQYFLNYEIPGHVTPSYQEDENGYCEAFPYPNRDYKKQADDLIAKIKAKGEVNLLYWMEHQAPTTEQIYRDMVDAENEERAEFGVELIPVL